MRRGLHSRAMRVLGLLSLFVSTPRHGNRPFAIAHLDHTELDVMMVSSVTGKPIGKPRVTFLGDASTRRLLSVYLNFDQPSYRSCMMACTSVSSVLGGSPPVLWSMVAGSFRVSISTPSSRGIMVSRKHDQGPNRALGPSLNAFSVPQTPSLFTICLAIHRRQNVHVNSPAPLIPKSRQS